MPQFHEAPVLDGGTEPHLVVSAPDGLYLRQEGYTAFAKFTWQQVWDTLCTHAKATELTPKSILTGE